MRNLGPASEEDLNAVGIYTADQLKALGVQAAFVQILLGRRTRGLSTSSCHANYLYALHGAIFDMDWRQIPDEDKAVYRAFTAELRASGSFSR